MLRSVICESMFTSENNDFTKIPREEWNLLFWSNGTTSIYCTVFLFLWRLNNKAGLKTPGWGSKSSRNYFPWQNIKCARSIDMTQTQPPAGSKATKENHMLFSWTELLLPPKSLNSEEWLLVHSATHERFHKFIHQLGVCLAKWIRPDSIWKS